MAQKTISGFEQLGGLVFSTDREMDLSAPEQEIDTPEASKQTLRVRRDTSGRRGKVVTLVEGFVGKDEDLQALGRDIKKYCGCGGSVKDDQVIIQGDLVQKIKSYLIEKGFSRTK